MACRRKKLFAAASSLQIFASKGHQVGIWGGLDDDGCFVLRMSHMSYVIYHAATVAKVASVAALITGKSVNKTMAFTGCITLR